MKLKKWQKNNHLFSLTVIMSLLVLAVFLVSYGIAVTVIYIISKFGTILDPDTPSYTVTFVTLIVVSSGAIFAFLGSFLLIRPIRRIIKSMDRLSSGDFKVRMDVSDSRIRAFKALSLKFNTLAEELQNTEMLRSDFINNFSHELKTPIVSIAGLAKVVKNGKLTDEEKNQYLAAIEEESVRLSYLATSVLNLTKIENQSILTDTTEFNLSEQMRSCILLLESKWDKKELDLNLDFNEIYYKGNEELLKQVWINLIDNAIKFSKEKSCIDIFAQESDTDIKISVRNEGEPIPEEKQKKIFNKFYQLDESHSSEGFGVGLAIVKRIVELHGGEISLVCSDGSVTFTVELPKENEE